STAPANDQPLIDVGGALGLGGGTSRSLFCLCLFNIGSGRLAVAYRCRSARGKSGIVVESGIVLPKRRASNDDKRQSSCRSSDFHAASDQLQNRARRLRQCSPKAIAAFGVRPVTHARR